MKIVSLQGNPELCSRVKVYCAENWNKVSEVFAETADKSVSAEALPQTWVLLGGEEENTILGFCQLAEHDYLTRFSDRSPFLTSLFIDKTIRGGGWGEMPISHAKYEAARLGYEKLYVSTDHIGYYEKYGFREIGLDIDAWGRPTKVYAAYTPSEVDFERFDRANPVPDRVHLEHTKFQWGSALDPNPAKTLYIEKNFRIPKAVSRKWFSFAAFSDGRLVGWVNFIRNSGNPLSWCLGDLVVAPDFRRKGIARRLIERGLDQIRSKMSGGESVCSYIEKENTPSILLHKSLGFIDTGECRPFENFIHGEDETTYLLQL